MGRAEDLFARTSANNEAVIEAYMTGSGPNPEIREEATRRFLGLEDFPGRIQELSQSPLLGPR